MSLAGACNLTEAEAIGLAQRGDAAAFEHLYRLHSRRVYCLCLRMVGGNAAQAEDLTQDAFLQLFKKIQSFRGDSAFSTWLHRITVNAVLMRLRKKSHVVASIEEMNERHDEVGGQPWEPGVPDLRLNGVIDRLNLERAIAQLPPGYRTMFVLHDIQGYEHEEIARIRGCSVGNSKSQLHKARTRLRQLLLEASGHASRSAQQHDEVLAGVDANLPVLAPPRLSRRERGRATRTPSPKPRPELRNLLPSRAH
jgi:RNA polymerase sigma-70 factor, ECF subfamily